VGRSLVLAKAFHGLNVPDSVPRFEHGDPRWIQKVYERVEGRLILGLSLGIFKVDSDREPADCRMLPENGSLV
jgi:hypothetical protein